MRNWLSLLIAIAIAVAVSLQLGCASPARIPAAAQAGPGVPPVPVVTLDGKTTDLGAVLAGRVAVVSLWATWCDACLAEMDALVRLQGQAARRGDAIVVGVAVGETRERVAAFAKRRGLTYDQLIDEDFRLVDALGEPRVPATLVIDRAGRIVFRGGALDAAGVAAFRSALRGSPE
jgi:cytochrome c biogenesis protein CcmG, thiol:disulfide interchange protein DsbE